MSKLALHIFIDLSVLVLISAVCIVTVWGVVVPKSYPVLSTGSFQLAAFDTNISFYQHARNSQYYALSPFNDYLITTNNVRNPILSYKDYQDKKYQVLSEISPLLQTFHFFKSFFNTPTLQFDLKSDHEVRYSATQQQNTFTITRTFIPASQTQVVATGSTFQFGNEDIVFDPVSHELYASPSEEQTSIVQKIYGIQLDALQLPEYGTEERWIVPSGKVSIINPETGGILTIVSHENQQMLVDPYTHLIELVEGVPDHLAKEIVTTMMVEVSQNLEK